MTWQEEAQLWATHPYFDEATRRELAAQDPKELEDRFYRSLAFGTGGLRGVIAAGTNRINRYTVRHATQGLADYIRTFGPEAMQRGVVIAHDSRRFSPEFARAVALTLNANGIVAYLWDSLRPTPMLSFAVRELGAQAGVVITASHNPPQYNGYKVYWEDGGQVPPERASAIQAAITAVTDLTVVQPMPEAEARTQGLLKMVPDTVDEAYQRHLLTLVTTDPAHRANTRILYTPLHGSGNIPVRKALGAAGYPVGVVAAQEAPNGDFPTVSYPNPEEAEVFTLAVKQAETERPDVILATDPDADRLGVMALDRSGQYQLLTGNQIGAILVDYLISSHVKNGTLPANAAVIKTIATSNLIVPLCRAHGVTLIDTHTGFKFIGDKIRSFEETGSHTFLFGFEESYGYLGATFVRDKDAVMAALLVAEATAFYKAQGLTLYDALGSIWERCGCFLEALHNVTLPGREGQAQIAALTDGLRQAPPTAFAGYPVAFFDDYETGESKDLAAGTTYSLALDRANVLHFRFADGGFVMVRPSGTEPKLKLYVSVRGDSKEATEAKLQAVLADVLRIMGL